MQVRITSRPCDTVTFCTWPTNIGSGTPSNMLNPWPAGRTETGVGARQRDRDRRCSNDAWIRCSWRSTTYEIYAVRTLIPKINNVIVSRHVLVCLCVRRLAVGPVGRLSYLLKLSKAQFKSNCTGCPKSSFTPFDVN